MSPTGGSDAQGVLAGLRAPLNRLLDEYIDARAELDTIIDTLRAALGDSSSSDEPAAPASEPAGADSARDDAGRTMRIEVRGADIARIIDFQERLALVADVSRVSVVGLENGRATLIVELGEPEDPTVICMGCGKTLVAGGRHQSHGLCDSCATAFKSQRRVPHIEPAGITIEEAARRFG